MAVPFIDLRRFEDDFLGRWAEKCAEISQKTMFVGGPEAQQLEERLKERTGATAVVGCANGTDALQLALRAAGVGDGDLVLIPDATFWATFEAVVNVGARPITVDIDLAHLQMDYDLFAEAAKQHKPKAAILVHLYGWVTPRLEEFRMFCREQGIALIEDGAQAFDVELKGKSVYQGAYISTLSFYPAKVLGSCGDAGAVFCDNQETAELVRMLGNHGRTAHYGHGYIGWNSRMGGFDAAFLNLSLDYIDRRIESRRASAEKLRQIYADLSLCSVAPPEGCKENGYLSVLLFEEEKRESAEAILKEHGIGFGRVYPGAMSQQPGAKDFLAGQAGGKKAEMLSAGVINPPLFAYMKDEEIAEINAALRLVAERCG